MLIKSFLGIIASASLSAFSVICGQIAAKYSNSLLVGSVVDRLSNWFMIFLGTPSFSAKPFQFFGMIDCLSSAKAISSKRPAWGEGDCTSLEVITSFTRCKSVQPAAVKEITY